MKKDFQLNIPAPCHENWADMRPEEMGRYCGACSKTVVDFSGMSDREIVRYLSRAGQQVCGRVAPEQLNRSIAVQPVAGKGWRRWWHWVLAGVLITSEAAAQPGAVKDSIRIKELPTVTVVGYPTIYCHRITGAMTTVTVEVDTLRQWVSDTLGMLGIRPKKGLSIYPNPVRKGMAVSLTWQGTEPGQYQVAIFSSSGAAVQKRVMEVASGEQVNLLEIPASLAGGVYFLRAEKAGDAKVVTRKLVVL